MPIARICLSLAMACLFALTAPASSSLTKDRVVLILIGLPGDLESEKTYGNEASRLLKILDHPAMLPSCVVLLSSLSAGPDFKPGYPLEKLSNERASFLGLVDKIKSAPTNPPVFFVFGHGGQQGAQAVFHVPGPRLTPDDFSAVAGASATSTWLLFFPGSGVFASAIQAQKRVILATEADQVFAQDPISFGVFLDLLNKEPNLDRLAPLLGTATDQWYTSRSLARIEEPALWTDGQGAHKLIAASTNASPDLAASSPPPATNTAAGLSPNEGAWKRIQSVEPRDYSKSDAVILSRRVSYLIDDASQITEEEETFLQILTRSGKRFGDFDFSYSPPDEDLSFSACEVKRADGQIEQVDPDNIGEAPGSAPEGYTVTNKKIFSMPHAEPGAILHVRLQRSWKHFQLPHGFEEVPLNDQLPIASLKVEVSLPKTSAFHFRFCQQPASDPVISPMQYGSVYSWQFQNIPAAPQEPLTASDTNPVLAISTFPDWAAFGNWYRRLIRESDLITPEISAEARDLTKDAKTDAEKIADLTQFVTNFRYVSIPLGVNSYRPHAAANILKSRYGDCKDKANLLNTLLRSLGYKTSLVLVPRFSQAYEDLPGFAFNHAISKVEVNNRTLWIDSTDDVCRIGLLPPGDPGRRVLVINDPANTLFELPQAVAHDHRLVLKTTADFPDSANREAHVQIRAETRGFADYLLRASAKAWNEKAKVAPLLDGDFYPASGLFEARQQDAADVSDLEHDFTWKADGTWSGLMSALPQSSTRLLRLPFWLPKEWPVALMPRTSPLQLNAGYPMEISQTCVVRLPTGSHEVKLPEAQHEDGSALSWRLSWSQASPSEVDADLELSLLQADLAPASIQQFQTSCRHLQNALQDGFSFQIP